MKRIRPLLAMALALALVCLGGSFAFADDEGNGRSVTDPSTMSDWQAVVGSDTSNIGRIWTDKTVSADETITVSSGRQIKRGNSAFITALSALSSTSNVASTSTTPLDIVLVLDASGSMDDPMGNSDRTKRIDALKNAANDFVSKIAAQNKGISDASKQHQVSIVKFAGNKSAAVGNDTYRGENGYTYNYSQVMKTMSPCTDANAFKDTINSISPAGSTRADYGLDLAYDQTYGQTSNREDAKKIVVFFTDGSPTSSNGFENGVASSAVASAKAMKGKGATVYTIGIFNGANPSADLSATGTSKENKFMHAVSSNYPDASYTSNYWGSWSWGLGQRAEGSDYYKSASNAAELEKVFEDISSEIVKGAGYPTSTTEGAEHQSGYIIFDDPLGAYMQVDEIKAIAVAGQTFEYPTKSNEGNTYTFSGTVELNGKNVNVGNVVITVTKSDDLATGDVVKVKVPAALIPLRSFDVDQDKMTMTVSDTQPINVVYTSSLKPEAENLLANPDDPMTQYLQANSQDGKASFYSNDWEQGYLGKTVASFEPSKENSYYYFTSDTPIYTDEACTQRAHQVVKGNTYWYKHSYFEMASGGVAEAKEKPVSFKGDDAEVVEGDIENNDEGAYFKSGTTRLTYLNELYKGKTSNDTGTALDVLNPKWVVAGQVGSYLGNNGKLSVDLPGTLAVTKQLEVPEGYTLSDFENDSFDFTIDIAKAANKGFSAVVKNASGEQQGNAFTLQFNEGKATHSLKAGETLYVYGLDGGWSYEVSEAKRNGFAQEGTGLKGAIAAGQTVNAKVVNTYSASGTLTGKDKLNGEKILTGRNWLSTDKFTFVLKPAEGSVDVPMPADADQGMARVEVMQPEGTPDGTKVPFNFGDITYTKPGVYTYEIHESAELSTLNPGVSESEALYEVTVTVTDENHTGNLTVTSEMKKLFSDDGDKVEPSTEADKAEFKNEYDTQTVKWAPIGAKEYTDSTDARPLERGMFHVIACTDDPDAPLPQLQGEQKIEGVRDGKTWYGAVTSVDANGTITFPQATYTYGNLGLGQTEKKFTYKIVEVVWDGNNWRSVEDALPGPDFVSAGVKYDPTIWAVEVTLTDDNGVLALNAQYSNNRLNASPGEDNTSKFNFEFTNRYEPKAAEAAIDGSKTLTGRDMKDGEHFGFELSAADDATQSAVKAGTVTIPTNTATVPNASSDNPMGFSFSKISFAKPGTYKFNVNETQWNGNALPEDGTDGLTFDRSTKTVTVVVTDEHDGSLKAKVVYPEDGTAFVTFVNQYNSSMTFAGIQVSKTLYGRTMQAGKFDFTIDSEDPDSIALLADTDKSFGNENNRADGVADVMTKLSGHTFTQADNGKHFEFTVKETIPEEAVWDQATGLWYVGATGLYYDGANHVVTIDVADDGNGQLTATTKVDGQVGNVVAFVNKYRAQDVLFDTANAQLKKILEGRDWLDSDSFTFNLKALTDGAPMPDGAVDGVATATVTKANAENFGFGSIIYTSDMLQGAPSKTFKYEVSEATGTIEGIDYATNKATITVTVVDNGKGKLTASASTENGTFVNRYTASVDYTANGGIQLAKVLKGRDMAEGQFKVAVTPKDAESANVLGLAEGSNEFAMPAGTDDNWAKKQILSDNVVFTQSDVGKTYTYTVAEVNEGAAGYTYDGTVYTVTIAVTISDTGKLTVTTTVTGGKSPETYVYTSDSAQPNPVTLAFTNSYKAEGNVTIEGTKTLSGRSLTNGEFSFAVKYAAGGDDLLSAKNDANGSIDFGTLSYSTESLAQLVKDGKAKKGQDGKWTVDYVACEKTDRLEESGITPQTESIHFTVTVVDNGNGTLAATANTGNNGLVFKNAYSTGDPIEVGLSGVKTLNAGEGLTPASIEGKFTFTVTSDDAAAPMPQKTTATNDANGNVDFGSITFSLDDLNKALGTTNTRATDTDNSAVSKGEDQSAQGAAAQNGAAGSDAADQADTEQGSAVDSGNGAEGQGAVMAADDGQGAASAKTVANDADAADDGSDQAQGSEPSTRAGVSRSHIFTYKVTESGSADGVTNDPDATKTVSFKVTDDGNGKLTVKRQDATSDLAFAFTNTYSVQPKASSVTDQVTVTKQLTGRDMAADEFAFELLEGNKVVATGTNGADGGVALSSITYTDPGTHSYTLREVGGGTHKAGVEYDGSVFAVTTTVTDNGDGTLSVAHKVDNDANAVGFTNTYAPAATSVTLGASKALNGKSLEDGEFSFALEGEDGTQLVAKNDANGMVAFPAIQYSKAGTYQYTLSEVKGTESGVTYDETTYAVAVAVEDDGEGSLVATVSYEGGKAPVFNNTYQEPEGSAAADDPVSFVKAAVSGVAKTGDSLLGIAGAIAAVAAAAAGVAVLSLRKKGKHAKK